MYRTHSFSWSTWGLLWLTLIFVALCTDSCTVECNTPEEWPAAEEPKPTPKMEIVPFPSDLSEVKLIVEPGDA